MKIIFDAMGGDNAPDATVSAALMFAVETDNEIEMVGKQEVLEKLFKEKYDGKELPKNISIYDAPDVIEMDDIPTKAIKEKKDSSIVVALRRLKEGKGDVVVSAGNTGALLAGAILILGRIKGVKRPAMLATIPTPDSKLYFVDAGANTNCDENILMQFAEMASIYVRNVNGIEKPRVGLLNIGEEDTKGNDFYKKTNEYFRENYEKRGINFTGNIEPNRAVMGEVDIAVSDGYTGNIAIKSMEGIFKLIKFVLKRFAKEIGFKKVFLLPLLGDAKRMLSRYNYKKESAGIFLGVSKPLVKTHGNSDEMSFYYALKQAEKYVDAGVIPEIEAKFKKGKK